MITLYNGPMSGNIRRCFRVYVCLEIHGKLSKQRYFDKKPAVQPETGSLKIVNGDINLFSEKKKFPLRPFEPWVKI